MNSNVLVQKIEFIKGVGPQKASLLNSEIGIYNLYDLLQYFPFRYEDRSTICLLYTSPSPRDKRQSRMPSSA